MPFINRARKVTSPGGVEAEEGDDVCPASLLAQNSGAPKGIVLPRPQMTAWPHVPKPDKSVEGGGARAAERRVGQGGEARFPEGLG